MKVLALDFQLKVCLKGARDVISSDLSFMKWQSSRGDLYWNRANRPPEVAAFSLKKILQTKFFFKNLRFDDLISENYSQGHKKILFFIFMLYAIFLEIQC